MRVVSLSRIGVCHVPSFDTADASRTTALSIRGRDACPDVPRTVNNPIRLGFAKPRVSGLPAAVGQHSEEILRELGHSESEIAVLKKAGALG